MPTQDELDEEYDEYTIAAWKHANRLARKIFKTSNSDPTSDFRQVRLEIFKDLLVN